MSASRLALWLYNSTSIGGIHLDKHRICLALTRSLGNNTFGSEREAKNKSMKQIRRRLWYQIVTDDLYYTLLLQFNIGYQSAHQALHRHSFLYHRLNPSN